MTGRLTRVWHVVTVALAFWSVWPALAAAQPVSLAARRDFAVGSNPCSPTVDDYNGDDLPDLAVTSGSSAAQREWLELPAENGSGQSSAS